MTTTHIPRADIDRVREHADIAAIIGEHVTLQPGSSGTLRGLCPFHDEQTPSFTVTASRGRFHCFGCGTGGDVFEFLMQVQHTPFLATVEAVAARQGIPLTRTSSRSEHGPSRSRLAAVNAAAATFFAAQLDTADAAPARAFLQERGLVEVAARFGVGYAPASFDALRTHLTGEGFTVPELIAAGVCAQGSRGAYDRFRGRLMFPIRDLTGVTIGFGARRLSDADQGPKYLNTPETELYSKSATLYGIDSARGSILSRQQVVMVEGYTDVLACHAAGVTNAIATCGTAATDGHARTVRTLLTDRDSGAAAAASEMVFLFDADTAGQRATGTAADTFDGVAVCASVVVAPGGADPCEVRQQHGDDGLRTLIGGRRSLTEFRLRGVLAAHNLDSIEGTIAALRAAGPVLAAVADPLVRDGYVRKVAACLHVDSVDVRTVVTAAAAA